MMYLLTFSQCGVSLSCRVSDCTVQICTVLYFGWMLLDNMDGKIARRTQSSSPLGLLFDHQVDALNVTIASTYFAVITMFGNSDYSLFLWVMGATPFFFATWEELYLGAMNFPLINGPCDGCVGIGIVSALIGIYTPEHFMQPTPWGLTTIEILFYALIFGAYAVGLYK
jgi:phosphatidylglycerophosphate synthase